MFGHAHGGAPKFPTVEGTAHALHVHEVNHAILPNPHLPDDHEVHDDDHDHADEGDTYENVKVWAMAIAGVSLVYPQILLFLSIKANSNHALLPAIPAVFVPVVMLLIAMFFWDNDSFNSYLNEAMVWRPGHSKDGPAIVQERHFPNEAGRVRYSMVLVAYLAICGYLNMVLPLYRVWWIGSVIMLAWYVYMFAGLAEMRRDFPWVKLARMIAIATIPLILVSVLVERTCPSRAIFWDGMYNNQYGAWLGKCEAFGIQATYYLSNDPADPKYYNPEADMTPEERRNYRRSRR